MMTLPPFTKPFFFRFGSYALVLNGIWELAQCPFLYDMSKIRPIKGAFWMAEAIAGDFVLSLVVIYVAVFLAGAKPPITVTATLLKATLVIGALVGLGAECIARAYEFWQYSTRMPVVRVGNVTVGLVPVLQMIILPALSLVLAASESKHPKT